MDPLLAGVTRWLRKAAYHKVLRAFVIQLLLGSCEQKNIAVVTCYRTCLMDIWITVLEFCIISIGKTKNLCYFIILGIMVASM